jgi:hypothetical protein
MHPPNTYDKFINWHHVLYKRQINGRVEVAVCHLRDDKGTRSQFLALALIDRDSGRWMVLKLSTVRKIWKFLVGKNLHEARRMTFLEKIRNAGKTSTEE